MPRKSTAKRRTGEGSSHQGYDDNLFTSFEKHDLYERRFKNRKILLGKSMNFDEFVGFNLRNLYEYMGWLPLCQLEGSVSPKLIRMFYANLVYGFPHDMVYAVITSFVKGKEIRFSEDILSEVFGICDQGSRIYASKSHIVSHDYDRAEALKLITSNQNFPVEQFPKNSELIPRAKLLHSLNTYIFLPRSGHRDYVNVMDTFLLSSLLNRQRVNLSYIIIHHVFEAYKNKANSLPFALLIQKVIEYFGVTIDDFDEVVTLGPNDYLGERHLRGLGFRQGRDNRWELIRNPRGRDIEEEGEDENPEEEEEEGEGEPSQNQGQGMPGQAQDSLELLRHDFNEFRGSVFEHFSQVNSNINRAFSLQEDFQRQQEEHHRQTQANHEEMMRMFQSMYPRPPPDY